MSTPDLVTLEQVKDALRINHSERDTILAAHIAAASSAIITYLKADGTEAFIVDGALVEENMPPEVGTATIMFVKLFEDGFTKDDFPDPDKPPFIVRALLNNRRTPTLA